MDAQSRTPQEGAAQARDVKAPGATAEEAMTPKGTLLILFLYAGAIVLLWGYMYVSMLMRR